MLLIASFTASPDVLGPLLELTETREWDLIVCPDPDAALPRLRLDRPDLIVVDDRLALSGTSGRVIRRLQACPELHGVPTLVVCQTIDHEVARGRFSRRGFSGTCDASDWDGLARAIEEATCRPIPTGISPSASPCQSVTRSAAAQ